MNQRQLGNFLLDAKYIGQYPEKALLLLAALGAVPVRAEMLFHNNSIEYTTIADKFEEVPVGHNVPHYDIAVTEGSAGEIISVVAIKLD